MLQTPIVSKSHRLNELEQQCRNCSKCPVNCKETGLAFGGGNINAVFLIVGEACGENERVTGIPFVGKAGILLNEELASIGITRKHTYLCNVIKGRPAIDTGKGRKNRPPTEEELKACYPYIYEQIKLIAPLFILCLGSPAAKMVIRENFKISRDRGILEQSKFSIPAVATFHPSYVLRQITPDGHKEALEAFRRDLLFAKDKVRELVKTNKERFLESLKIPGED